MASNKLFSLLLLSLIAIVAAEVETDCGTCPKYKHPVTGPVYVPKLPIPPVTGVVPGIGAPKIGVGVGIGVGPVIVPPKVKVPPVTVPKLPLPPVTGVPKIGVGAPKIGVGVGLPPVTTGPKLPLPPVTGVGAPKIGVGVGVGVGIGVGIGIGIGVGHQPVIGKPKGAYCPPPPAKAATCPIDTLKLGACVDVLGGLIHIGLGEPSSNPCCPVISGLLDVEAAVCLCTSLKIKALSLNIYLPLALELLITCGKTPPPGFTCTL